MALLASSHGAEKGHLEDFSRVTVLQRAAIDLLLPGPAKEVP